MVEVVAAVYANSMSLLGDAAHNFADVLGLLMAWGATWLLNRSATEKFSYGYKKSTILSALANAFLLVATSAIIIYEAVLKLIYPTQVHESIVIIVALFGIVINGGAALLFIKEQGEDLNIKGAYLHLAYDALISLGVVIGGVLMLITKWWWLDPVVGILIVLVILKGTLGLLRDSVSLILGAVPYGIDSAAVRSYFSSIDGVAAVHDLHIWGLSTRETALTVHLIMPNRVLSDAELMQINHDLQHVFKINHVTIQVEKGNADNPCGQVITC